VHRKGATRAFPPGHPELPEGLREAGQPVLIGGSMGTASYVLAGNASSTERAFCSACHGAGRSMSRNEATRRWSGRRVVDELRDRGILVRSPSLRGRLQGDRGGGGVLGARGARPARGARRADGLHQGLIWPCPVNGRERSVARARLRRDEVR
jgi:hypothetical protein